MRILIAGLGSIGRRHLRNLITLGYEDLILYRTGKSTLPEDELRGLKAEYDLESAFNHKPEAVVISNPTSLHLDIAIPAARRGCHLFLEKPISHSLEGIDQLEALVSQMESRVLVGFQFRFHPALQYLKTLLVEGRLGRPLSARAYWGEYLPNWHPWEDYRSSYSAKQDLGGGVVLTLCHPFDYLRWLFGEVKQVRAELRTVGDLDLEVEDTADILLCFEHDVLANIHLNYTQRPPVHTLEVVGTEGTARFNNETSTLETWTTGTRKWETILPSKEFERNSLFLDEMRHFMAVSQGQAQSLCSLEDGVKVLKIIQAIKQSSAEGVRVNL